MWTGHEVQCAVLLPMLMMHMTTDHSKDAVGDMRWDSGAFHLRNEPKLPKRAIILSPRRRVFCFIFWTRRVVEPLYVTKCKKRGVCTRLSPMSKVRRTP